MLFPTTLVGSYPQPDWGDGGRSGDDAQGMRSLVIVLEN